MILVASMDIKTPVRFCFTPVPSNFIHHFTFHFAVHHIHTVKDTLTERVSKLNLVIPIDRKEAELTKEAIIQALKPFASWDHTHTFDNGREFCLHGDIAKALACATYFAKPYHSWERSLR